MAGGDVPVIEGYEYHEDEIIAVRLRMGGDWIDVMAAVEIDGTKVTLRGCYIDGSGTSTDRDQTGSVRDSSRASSHG